jgi:TolB-like protein/Tfp pilus assembly protein PilF
MPSLITGFEYDIFISYRQKDNKYDGWVTDFVSNLKKELEATFKDDVSIYFDANPVDGLMETHDVGDSLKYKLNCLIFIPIVSQTYCDPKSFAWKHEFLEFKKHASESQFGLKIRLENGNVASRILPISIHELDSADKGLLEGELGGVLRGIDFIYRTAGVVRPLKSIEEEPKANLNHTYYRDQINKVARSIKELIGGFQNRNSTPSEPKVIEHKTKLSSGGKKKIAISAAAVVLVGLLSFMIYYFGGFGKQVSVATTKSIAVLPFENMTKDAEQDYFTNGIAEDILNHLTKISDLRIKSRTSTLQYKGTTKSILEIGNELGVENVVEGSVRRVGDKVRIVVQLIDAEKDEHLWSETYDRELKDVLAVQSEIAIEIASALRARLTDEVRTNISKEASTNITAYDYFLKARELASRYNGNKADVENVFPLINKAIALDPHFAQAYALKARLWFLMRVFGVSQKVWQDSAFYYCERAIEEDRSVPDAYVTQGYIHSYLGDSKSTQSAFEKAYAVAPGNPEAMSVYGGVLLRNGDKSGADLVLRSIENQYTISDPRYYMSYGYIFQAVQDLPTQVKLLNQSKELDPGSIGPHWSLAHSYWRAGEYEKALDEALQAEKINPNLQNIVDLVAWLSYLTGDLKKAEAYWSRYKEIEATFEDTTQTVPFRARLAMVYEKTGRKKEGDALVAEDMKIREGLIAGHRSMGSWSNAGSVYYDLAVDQAYFGNSEKAVQYLDSALANHHAWSWGYHSDPMFADLKHREDYKKLIASIEESEAFTKSAYTQAISRMEASKQLRNLLK